jgi:hypothetical protein
MGENSQRKAGPVRHCVTMSVLEWSKTKEAVARKAKSPRQQNQRRALHDRDNMVALHDNFFTRSGLGAWDAHARGRMAV